MPSPTHRMFQCTSRSIGVIIGWVCLFTTSEKLVVVEVGLVIVMIVSVIAVIVYSAKFTYPCLISRAHTSSCTSPIVNFNSITLISYSPPTS